MQNSQTSYIRKPVDFERFTEAVRQLGLCRLLLNEPPPHEVGYERFFEGSRE